MICMGNITIIICTREQINYDNDNMKKGSVIENDIHNDIHLHPMKLMNYVCVINSVYIKFKLVRDS